MSGKYVVRSLVRRLGYDLTSLHEGFAKFTSDRLSELGISTVLDVGANEGQYAQWIRSLGFRGRIVSFEPLDGAYARLARHAAGDRDWTVHRVALGATSGELPMNVSQNSQSSSLLAMLPSHEMAAPASRYIGEQVVAVQPLTAFADDVRGSAWMKVDVQGAELDVLAGASALLDQVPVVQLELSLRPLYEGAPSLSDAVDAMVSKGYVLSYLNAGFEDPRTGRMLQADGVFIREPVTRG